MPNVKTKKGVSAAKTAKQKPIGTVTHYYGGLGVAIVKFTKPVETGAHIRFEGATTAFSQTASSLEYDHKPITVAKKGQEVGMKVEGKVREGDHVYAAD